jgi:hypothetical protein
LILATILFPARRRTSLIEQAIDQKISVSGVSGVSGVYGVDAVASNTNLVKINIADKLACGWATARRLILVG